MAPARVLAVLLIALLATVAAAAGDARAAPAEGKVEAGMQPEGYARLIFRFDDMPKPQARLANGVLTVNFARPVTLDLGGVARGLPGLLGTIRLDPDGTAIRIALVKPAKLNANEAGDALYVDLMPSNWVGLPPSLPKEVIAELGRAAREAREAQARAAALAGRRFAPLTVEGATHPTFRRLIFKVDRGVSVDLKRSSAVAELIFGAPLLFDVAAARAGLPPEVAPVESKRVGDTLRVLVPAAEGHGVRGFYEDGVYILDVDRADASEAEAAAAKAPALVAPPPGHDAPEEKHGAAAAPAPAPAPAAPAVPEPAPRADLPLGRPDVSRAGETVRIAFPFQKLPPAAIFLRGRTLWALFDDPAPMALDRLVAASGGVVVAASRTEVDRGQLIRLTLPAPHLVTVAAEGAAWSASIGDAVLQTSEPVTFAPSFGREGRAALAAKLPRVGMTRALADPDVGDTLLVATLGGPPRGLLRPQSFVEVVLLPTAHGVAALPLADDVRAMAGFEEVRFERDRGLTLSSVAGAPRVAARAGVKNVFDEADAAEALAEPFLKGERRLLDVAALAPADARTEPRVALARYYLFRDMPAEAAAVLDAVLSDDKPSERDPKIALMRAAAAARLGRPAEVRSLLAVPQLALNPEAALWRALAEAEDGRPDAAREALRMGQSALDAMPPRMRARFVELSVRLALDTKDHAAAVTLYDQLEVLPAVDGVARREILRGRVLEGLGQDEKALAIYAAVAGGRDPVAAAEATLRSVELGVTSGKLKPQAAIERLERLVTGWRGDWIEAEGLARLAGLYADAERWRDAFGTLKTAVEAYPESPDARTLQEKMQGRFADLFLGAAVDRMPKLDALALFYDFQDLSPGGKRGDELVRRLADKLVEVDLLSQAGKLLVYQIDNRLTGAARAQVAARAAIVFLMDGKPDEAAAVLKRTRQADLPASLVRTRLTLEARALAQSGRTELALEMAEGIMGDEAMRLKADILWGASRWNEAGEALESALGSAWREEGPLDPAQRADVMRAAIALSLADDRLGLDRIRQKFARKMADSADAQTFEVVTAPVEARGEAFRDIARSIAATATIEGFLRDYRRRSAEEAMKAEGGVAGRAKSQG